MMIAKEISDLSEKKRAMSKEGKGVSFFYILYNYKRISLGRKRKKSTAKLKGKIDQLPFPFV